MCLECGCSEPEQILINGKTVKLSGHHDHDHDHDHSHEHESHSQDRAREIGVNRNILDKNNHIARHNREHLKQNNVFCMNWISAPGSGKTSILERLIKDYGSQVSISVIEGDQQTDNDARRIRRAGVDALQINTGAACHLDAEMIHKALHQIAIDRSRLLIIENVGNMVCPAAYDLGENLKAAVVSSPEGDDKPVKYPDLILASDILLINKIDLIPYLDFNLETCASLAKKINPEISIFPVSAKTGEGFDDFYSWLIKHPDFPLK